MKFSQAWDLALSGSRITREAWPVNTQLEVQWPDEAKPMALAYLFITYSDGSRQPWEASQIDLFATDWTIAP